MISFIKFGIISSCIVFFSVVYGFAQQTGMQDISNPEFSKMDKNQNGLISSS